jgi:hypothetical protein
VPEEGSPSDVPPAAFDRYQVLQQGDDERMTGSVDPIFHQENSTAGYRVAAHRPWTSFSAVAMAFTLITGLALGAVAGYSAGSARAERMARVMADAPGPVGRDYTDAMVEPMAPRRAPARIVPVERLSARIPQPRSEPRRPAGIIVLSRPSGASVTIDGRRVGATPVVMPAVAAGTHVVRIQRPGYRPWVTRVRVAEGARARVAASLVGGRAKE